MSERPAVVDVASWLMWLLVVAGAGVSAFVVVFRERIGSNWSPPQAGDSQVEPLHFVPVIVVLYGVVALTMMFLIPLLRHGHNWGRLSLAGICVGILLSGAATVRTAPPTSVQVAAIAAAVVAAVSLVFLWHPLARRYCRAGLVSGDAAAS